MSYWDNQSELGELILANLDGTANAQQHGQLEKLLTENAEARQYYGEFLLIYADLCHRNIFVPGKEIQPEIGADNILLEVLEKEENTITYKIDENRYQNKVEEIKRDAEDALREFLEQEQRRNAADNIPPYVHDPSYLPYWVRSALGFGGRVLKSAVSYMWKAAAACLVILLGFGVYHLLKSGPVLTTGVNTVIERQERQISAGNGMRLEPGDVIKTGPGGRAVVKYQGEDTTIELKENTSFKLASSENMGKLLEITEGTIHGQVARQPSDKPMILDAPQATVKVLGTDFTFALKPDSSWIRMNSGTVEMTRKADCRSIKVDSNHYAVAGSNYSLAAKPVSDFEADFSGLMMDTDFENDRIGYFPTLFRLSQMMEGAWRVEEIQGNRVLKGRGKNPICDFGNPGWRDYRLSVRVYFDTPPERLGVIVRDDPITGKNYQFELRPTGVMLIRSLDQEHDSPEIIRSTNIERVEPGQWHDLAVICQGDKLEFWVDGRLAIQTRQSWAPQGVCRLMIINGQALFDDLAVSKLSDLAKTDY